MRTAFALASLLVLAACGGGEAGSNSAAPAEPVAAVAPPAGQQWSDVVSKTPEGGFRMGNPDAPIKLVEYGSRTCPACGAFAKDGFEPLSEKVRTGSVSFEFRDYLIHGAADIASAVLGRCGGPAPFFPMLEQMYAQQSETLDRLQNMPANIQEQMQGMPPAQAVSIMAEQGGYLDFVKQRGVSESQARQCLADTGTIDELVKMTEDATEVTGTPSFFINGEKQDGAIGWSDVEAALKRAGA